MHKGICELPGQEVPVCFGKAEITWIFAGPSETSSQILHSEIHCCNVTVLSVMQYLGLLVEY